MFRISRFFKTISEKTELCMTSPRASIISHKYYLKVIKKMDLLMHKLLSHRIIKFTIKTNSLFLLKSIKTVLIKILQQMNVNKP
jgi:hypothetical protein